MRLENPAICNSHIPAQCRIDTGPKGHKSCLQKQEITAFRGRELGKAWRGVRGTESSCGSLQQVLTMGCGLNLKAMRITSDPLSSSAFSRAHTHTHLWKQDSSPLGNQFLSISFCFLYSLYLFKLGLAPQITDLYGKVAFTGEFACCGIKSLSLYKNSWKRPCSWELWSM